MIRRTLQHFYPPRGRFSSMLDMGGMSPSDAAAAPRINVGKNNKVRAVALDFHLITRSIEERRRMEEKEKENTTKPSGSAAIGSSSNSASTVSTQIQPDASLVEKMAKLLNVQLGGGSSTIHKPDDGENDDLSAILGNTTPKNTSETPSPPIKKPPITNSPPHMDIRSKYASKLRNKIEGGVAGIELAKTEQEDTLKRGDAKSHLAARALISSHAISDTSSSSSRWLATTGVGKLLSFLSNRSMQIALLPLPSTPSNPQSSQDVKKTADEMESLTKQLPNVHFDLLIPDGRRRGEEGREKANEDTAKDVLDNVLSKIDIRPLQFMVVSDRDDYLRAARDIGMFTCRVRPKNRRRGEVTASYNVEDVGSVEGVINEINGISFNSALKG